MNLVNRQNLELFYTKKAANGFDELFELIYELHNLFEKEKKKISWTQKKNLAEHGFRLKSKSGKYSLFFGVYWDFWAATGYPICITLESKSEYITEDEDNKFKEFIEIHLGNFGKYYDFENLNVCGLTIDFICQDINVIKKYLYDFYLNLQLVNR